MKAPAFLFSTLALAACTSTITEPPESTALNEIEALDVASAQDLDSDATSAEIVPAKSEKETTIKSDAEEIEVAAVIPASADATCNRGTMTGDRSFIICEDGALRKAGVVTALSAPHDPKLTIENVAERYGVAPQVLTGIESTTYGSLVNSERRSQTRAGKSKAQTGLVQIQGKVYEVYQLSSAGKTGTVFVERDEEKAQN